MPTNIGRYGWTVPEGTDSPSGPEQFTELASDIEATIWDIDSRASEQRFADVEGDISTLKTAVKDTGWVDLTSVVTFAANYGTAGAGNGNICRGRRFGKMAALDLHAKRATANLVADAVGNFTDHDVLTIDDPRFVPFGPPGNWGWFGLGVAGAYGATCLIISSTKPVHWMMQNITGASGTVSVGQSIHFSVAYMTDATY